MKHIRSLINNNDAVVVISRFLAIGIPMLLLVIFHACNALGYEIWEPLISVAFACGILVSGAIILVLGLKVGFYYPVAIIAIIWVIIIYVYIQFEANLIFIPAPIFYGGW